MATRTWKGTTNDNPTVATNWEEGVVPVAGDNVVFNSTYSNPCTLVADFPATGQFQSLTMVGYTGTLNFGDYKMYVGQGNYNGTILDAGSTADYTCGSGGIELYTNATTTINYNVIKCNNVKLHNVNFFLRSAAFGRYIDTQTDWYCKDFTIVNNNTYFAARTIGIYIYGSFIGLGSYNNAGVDLFTNTSSINLAGSGIISFNNLIQIYAPVTISGNYILNKNASFFINNSSNNAAGIYVTGSLNCNTKDLIILFGGLNFPHYVSIPEIDSLVITQQSNYNAYIVFTNTTRIYKKFQLFERALSRVPYCLVKSPTNGTLVDIVLGNNCKYLIYGNVLQDLRFNIPVKAFYSRINNCENVINGEFPDTKVSIC